MEAFDQADYHRGDGTIHIPNTEQLPLPPSTDLQGRYSHWRMVTEDGNLVPDLSGRTPEEVEAEAGRLKLWEEFDSFDQFNRCLHSWSVREGRAYHKFKTKWDMHVRVCRFGEAARKPWRGNQPDSRPDVKHGKENSTQNCTPVPNSSSSIGQNSRVPLFDLTNNPRDSFVRHTREWIPGSFPRQAIPAAEKVRTISKTGACGQQSRLLGSADDLSCNAPPCPFRVHCSRLSDGKLVITQLNPQHTCPRHKSKWRGPIQKSMWLGETMGNRVTRNPRVPIKELMSGLQTYYKKICNYHQMWHARDMVKDMYLGGQRKSFHMIPSLLDRMKTEDPDCVVDWSTREDSKVFQRAFICPSATRNAMEFCQPQISLDACHTKNRKFPSQLFLATVLDGNSEVFILCYGIAPVENYENWLWFCLLLKEAIHGSGNVSIPLISDRQKGLSRAVRKIFPGSVHGHCAFHLRGNVKKNFGKAAEQFFWELVYAPSKKRFEKLLDHMSKIKKGVAVVDYIRKLDEKLYSRQAFPLPRLGKVTSNPAEQANSGLLEMREYAPFKLLVGLWDYIQRKFNSRRITAENRAQVLTVPADRRHNVNLRSYGQWSVADDGRSKAKISTTDGRLEYVVSLSPVCSCTCFELQKMIWPCEHVMAWDDRDDRDFTRHFHTCWKTETLRSLYAPILPVLISIDLDSLDSCFPPTPAVKKGRHRVIRIESGRRMRSPEELGPDEYYDAEGSLFVRYPIEDEESLQGPVPPAPSGNRQRSETGSGEQVLRARGKIGAEKSKCGACQRSGHNSRTCHKFPPVDHAIAGGLVDEEHSAGGEGRLVENGTEQESQIVQASAPPVVIPEGMYSESDTESDASDGEFAHPLFQGDWVDDHTWQYFQSRFPSPS